MIQNEQEYQIARKQLQDLERWLERLEQTERSPDSGLTKAGIRKMMARLHEELGLYEGIEAVSTVGNEREVEVESLLPASVEEEPALSLAGPVRL